MADKNGATESLENSAKRQKLDGMPQKTTLNEFEAVFPKLEADLVEHAQKYKLPQGELDWYKAVGCPSKLSQANCISSTNLTIHPNL